jgi:hypothetical protein
MTRVTLARLVGSSAKLGNTHAVKVRNQSCACRWQRPVDNIIAAYFEACTSLQVSATTRVAAAVAHRKHMMSPFPYHVFDGKTRLEKVQLVVQMRDFEQEGALRMQELWRMVAVVAPLVSEDELRASFAVFGASANTVSMTACTLGARCTPDAPMTLTR